jgi:hypothetical protein
MEENRSPPKCLEEAGQMTVNDSAGSGNSYLGFTLDDDMSNDAGRQVTIQLS